MAATQYGEHVTYTTVWSLAHRPPARPSRGSQDAHQALGDAVALGDAAGQILLGLAGVASGGVLQVDVGPSRFLGAALGVHAQGRGRLLGPLAELGEGNPLVPKEGLHASGVVEAQQVLLEDHAVEHRQTPDDTTLVDRLEARHRHPPCSTRYPMKSVPGPIAVCFPQFTPTEGKGPALPARHRPVPQKARYSQASAA